MPFGLVTPSFSETPAPWNFQLASLATGANLADITGMLEREMKFSLSGPSTFTGKLDIAHPAMASLATNPHCYIKAYRRGFLKELFECQTGELIGNDVEHSIKITGMSAGYKSLGGRFIGQSSTGSTYTNLDRTAASAAALLEANTASTTAVALGTIASAGLVTAGPYRYKNLLQLVNDLGRTLSGYDHWITALDPALWGGLIGMLNMTPIRGAYREDALLEYGTGRANAREYKLFWNNGDRTTRAITLPPGFPDNIGLLAQTAVNALDGTPGIRRREALIDNDIPDNTLRQLLATEHVTLRKDPQQIFTIQPHVYDGTGRTPQFLQDYDVGDIVEGRIIDEGLVFLDALVRVYGATVNLDDAGVEEVTLVTVQEDAEG